MGVGGGTICFIQTVNLLQTTSLALVLDQHNFYDGSSTAIFLPILYSIDTIVQTLRYQRNNYGT